MEQVEKMSTSQLIAEQHEDPEVSPIFSRSVSESEVSQNPTCYFTKNGVLMKTCRPHHVPTKEEWAVQYQMIVPKTYRPDVLSTADETPLTGHPGVNKTCQKILDHFYWLSLRKVVAQYCQSFTPVRWLRNRIRSFQKYRYSHHQPFKSHLAEESLLIV